MKRQAAHPVTPTKRIKSSSKLIDVEDTPLTSINLNTLHKINQKKNQKNAAITPISPPITPVSDRIIKLSPHQQLKTKFMKNFKCDPISRDDEISQIRKFINSNERIMYVYGSPGTGKTQVINHVYETTTKQNIYKINCFANHSIYSVIFDKLSNSITKKKTFEELVSLVEDLNKSSVIILDEVDNLNKSDISKILTLTNYNIKIITISNNLNILSCLNENLVSQISKLEFKSYTDSQIQEIIKAKSKDCQIFHPTAISYLSKKTSTLNGDIRKIFDIIIKSIESIEDTSTPKILISHIAKTFTNYSNAPSKKITRLNFYQKQITCLATTLPSSQRTINNLYDTYNKSKFNNISKTEFLEIIANLEMVGLLEIGDSKLDMGLRKFSVLVSVDELRGSLDNDLLLKMLKNQ